MLKSPFFIGKFKGCIVSTMQVFTNEKLMLTGNSSLKLTAFESQEEQVIHHQNGQLSTEVLQFEI